MNLSKMVGIEKIMSIINKDKCIFAALCCCFLTAFFLPFSTALTNIFSIATVFFWLLGADLKRAIKKLFREPFAIALMFFLFLVVSSALWKEGSWSAYWSELRNYRRFVLFLVFFLLLQNRDTWRERILFAFFLSTAILAMVCLGIFLGVPGFPAMTPGQGAIFHKSHIAQGFLLGCHIVIAIRYIVFSPHCGLRVLGVITAVLAYIVSIFMTNGRTGYLCVGISIIMCAIFFIFEKNRRAAILSCGIILVALLAGVFSSHVQSRLGNAREDIAQFYQGNKDTSMGQRFYFWQTSVNIIESEPVLGIGCGSMKEVSCKYAVGTPNKDGTCYEIRNPHQDYLFVLVQFGIVGFLVWMSFFVLFLKKSLSFTPRDRWGVWGIAALFLAGSFFNTFSRDITECTTFVLLIAILLSTRGRKKGTL